MDTPEVMALLRYTEVGSFFAAIRSAGLPMVKINARKYLFERVAVEAWLQSRTIGRALPSHNQPIGNN